MIEFPIIMEGVGDDDEAIALVQAVAACALDDIAELQAAHKGKSKDGVPLPDDQLALELFADEARALLQSTRDLEIALGLEKAMRMDAAILEEHRTMEERASRDHEMALALDQGRQPPRRPPTPLSPEPDEGAVESRNLVRVSFALPDEYVFQRAGVRPLFSCNRVAATKRMREIKVLRRAGCNFLPPPRLHHLRYTRLVLRSESPSLVQCSVSCRKFLFLSGANITIV